MDLHKGLYPLCLHLESADEEEEKGGGLVLLCPGVAEVEGLAESITLWKYVYNFCLTFCFFISPNMFLYGPIPLPTICFGFRVYIS